MKALHSFSFPWRRVLALFFAFLVCTALWAEATQAQLAEKVIRLHVLANSDSQADQTLKLQVRDKILAQTASLLSGQESAAQAAAILQDNLDALAQTAAQEIAARGYHYPVKVCLEETWFPTRQYENVSLPAGNYQALRVLIGEGAGKNWWCVLYPPLCFVDTSYGVLPDTSKDTLKNILTEDEYNAITNTRVEYRCKYLTFLNRLFAEKK